MSENRLVARWIGWSAVPIWSTAPVERLRRSLARAGVWDAGPWTGRVPAEGGGAMLLLRGDHVYDDALVETLVASMGLVVMRGDGQPVAAHIPRDRAEELAACIAEGAAPPPDLPRRRGRDVVPPAALRRRARPGPLVMPVSVELREAVENRLFAIASPAYADAVARVLWPLPARALARLVANAGLAPNQVSALTLILALLTAVFFHAGLLGAGLATAWATSLVGAVDGKLARLTLSFSQVGAGLSHLLAMLHPPLWWWAWWVGGGGGPVAMAMLVAGSLALPAVGEVFERRHGFPLHEWRRFDSLFQLVAADRNILLLPLSLGWLAGMPTWGFRSASVWLLLTLAVQGLRLAQSWRTPQESWLADRDWKPRDPPPI